MNLLTIFIPLLLAICSGLAILAYRHPKGFETIYLVLSYVLGAAFLMYLSWMFGFQSGFYSAGELDRYEDGIPISMGYSILIYISVILYLKFLVYLRKIINADNESTKDD